MTTIRRISWMACALAWLGADAARAELRYTVTDLGNLGGRAAAPYGMNGLGHAVGQGSPAASQAKPFFWSLQTGMVDFLPAGTPGSFPTGSAFGVNDHDQVVGHYFPDQNTAPRAYVWSPIAGFRSLGTLGGADSWGTAINNAGRIAGYSGIPNGLAHAFIYDSVNGMRDIATIGSNSYAQAINDSGQIAGMTTVAGQFQAFRWSDQTGMVLIGTLGGVGSEAYGINSVGHIVGLSATAEGGGNLHSHAFLYDDSGMHDLGTLGGTSSKAQGINDDGWVVGYSYLAGDQPPVHAFVHDGDSMRDLNDFIDPASGWSIRDAHAINNAGQIVALAARDTEPWAHAVLLTPVPEPATFGALTALAALAATERRQRLSLVARRRAAPR